MYLPQYVTLKTMLEIMVVSNDADAYIALLLGSGNDVCFSLAFPAVACTQRAFMAEVSAVWVPLSSLVMLFYTFSNILDDLNAGFYCDTDSDM